jgi:Cys-rich protein (TIGR01571 family)
VCAEREDGAPIGAWRDGVCDCCIRGVCHPSCCMSWCCPPLAMGQVMTRMRLGWSAESSGYRLGGLSQFKIMVILTVFYYAVYMSVGAVAEPYTNMSDVSAPPVVPGWVALLIGFRSLVGIGVFMYVLIARIRTRAYIRNKYAIPEQYCSGCDDCCLSFWCGCCTTAQMLRHTVDYGAHSADCCSETGFSQQFPYPV